jgi:hypothetical protein
MTIPFDFELLIILKLTKVETTASENYNNISEDQTDRIMFYPDSPKVENIDNNPLFGNYIPGISEDFSFYLQKLNLAGDPNIVVLSSTNHYYYEAEDLKNVKTLVNVKQLNHINQVREFLDNIFSILPSKSYLVGCFSDNEDQNRLLSDSYKPGRKIDGQFDPAELGIASRNPFLNMVYNILDIKTNRYLTTKAVTRELEVSGWKVADITIIRGLTYFCAQKILVN